MFPVVGVKGYTCARLGTFTPSQTANMIRLPDLGPDSAEHDVSTAPAPSKPHDPPPVATQVHTSPDPLLTHEISPCLRRERPVDVDVDVDGPDEMLKKYHGLIDEKWVLIREIAALEGKDELEAKLSEVERLECYVCSMKSKVHGLEREARR